jgi:hypothetical protein
MHRELFENIIVWASLVGIAGMGWILAYRAVNSGPRPAAMGGRLRRIFLAISIFLVGATLAILGGILRYWLEHG